MSNDKAGQKQMKNLLSKLTLTEAIAIMIAAIITVLGGGYFAIRAAQEPVRMSIAATQTAEAIVAFSMEPTVTPIKEEVDLPSPTSTVMTVNQTPTTSIIAQPTDSPIPEISTPRIIYLEDVEVAGKDSDGTSWHIPSTGTYIITLKSGAYNGWENDAECEKTDHAEQGCWKTTIFIYRNCEIDWIRKEGADLDEPGNPDFRIGDDGWQESEEIAAEIARLQDSLRIDLQQGECLKFVAIDGTDQETGWSAYSDNRGIVILDVSYLSP